jgi:hypothetical protein
MHRNTQTHTNRHVYAHKYLHCVGIEPATSCVVVFPPLRQIGRQTMFVFLNALPSKCFFAHCRPSTSLQRLIRLDRVNRRDRFSMKKSLRSSARGASFHTKHASNVNAIETY